MLGGDFSLAFLRVLAADRSADPDFANVPACERAALLLDFPLELGQVIFEVRNRLEKPSVVVVPRHDFLFVAVDVRLDVGRLFALLSILLDRASRVFLEKV